MRTPFRDAGARAAFERRVLAGLKAIGIETPKFEWDNLDDPDNEVIFLCDGLSLTEMKDRTYLAEVFAATPGSRHEPPGGDLVELASFPSLHHATTGFVELHARHAIEQAIQASDENEFAQECNASSPFSP